MLVVGAGAMSRQYVKVLAALGEQAIVVGRSDSGCHGFFRETGVVAVPGGLDAYLSSGVGKVGAAAIVAVGTGELCACVEALLRAGLSRVLVEKPGGMSLAELERLARTAEERGADVRVAYNRRYFQSVQRLKTLSEMDGGVTSFHFEFTEWAHVVEKLDYSAATLSRWLLANSTHVIDTAFYLGGAPSGRMLCLQAHPMEWHAYGCFTGAGVTRSGALFSYAANWGSAGRWSVEVMTALGRYTLSPMEALRFQRRGERTDEVLEPESDLDRRFKPGLFRMVEDFIAGKSILPTMRQQCEMARVYFRIAGYDERPGMASGQVSAA